MVKDYKMCPRRNSIENEIYFGLKIYVQWSFHDLDHLLACLNTRLRSLLSNWTTHRYFFLLQWLY